MTILDGPDVPELSVRLFEVMQAEMANGTSGTLNWYGQEKSHDEFKRLVVEERRIIYEFEVLRTYGLYGAALKR